MDQETPIPSTAEPADARTRLRTTFDDVASRYDTARPGYPEQVYDDIVAWTAIPAGGRILEVGCGTGQATLPFARRGFRIQGIELGANMAALARHKLAAYPDVAIDVGAFEAYPFEEGTFDLAISATAFHWIDPAVGYPRLAQALRPGGSIALFWNQHVQAGDRSGFFDDVQHVYERVAPEIIGDYHPLRHPAEEPATELAAITDSGRFEPVEVRRYHWTIRYDAPAYLAVLDTYSGHRSLPTPQRERLLQGIADLIDMSYGGSITKGYLTLLYLAHLATEPSGVHTSNRVGS